MTNIDVANGMVFQALGVKKDSFDNRIISQKKIFYFKKWELILAIPIIGISVVRIPLI